MIRICFWFRFGYSITPHSSERLKARSKWDVHSWWLCWYHNSKAYLMGMRLLIPYFNCMWYIIRLVKSTYIARLHVTLNYWQFRWQLCHFWQMQQRCLHLLSLSGLVEPFHVKMSIKIIFKSVSRSSRPRSHTLLAHQLNPSWYSSRSLWFHSCNISVDPARMDRPADHGIFKSNHLGGLGDVHSKWIVNLWRTGDELVNFLANRREISTAIISKSITSTDCWVEILDTGFS